MPNHSPDGSGAAERGGRTPKVLCVGIEFAWPRTVEEIDLQGIVHATRLAAIRALHQFSLSPEYLLTDFRLELPQLDISQTSLVKGDARCLSIACASILAKTKRDALMRELDKRHPGYQLGKHKGYGTQAHRSALKRLGLSPIHRRSFKIK